VSARARPGPVLLAAFVAIAGGAATLVLGLASGMGGTGVAHLALLMLPAAAVTLLAVVGARRLLRRASFRWRLAAIAGLAVLASLANLAVLAGLMFVSAHDAALMAALLIYATGAGLAAALVLAREPTEAVGRLVKAADELAKGRLDTRVGRLDAGPELANLGAALDAMADALERSIGRERTSEAKRRDLVTAVSHDLRTPLARLRAMVEAIEDGVVDDAATIRRYVGEMRGSVDTLVVLVDDLFELVQLDAGAIEAETRRARLEDVITSALAACEPDAAAKGLAVERRLDGAGGTPCSPRLVRVLQNLLQNAIRHTPPDGTVRIEARREGDEVEVAVEDTGEGIPADALDRIFEPFWRGDPARAAGGSGLGLTLAKRIVDALGGDIRVESSPARGTRFAVSLPAA